MIYARFVVFVYLYQVIYSCFTIAVGQLLFLFGFLSLYLESVQRYKEIEKLLSSKVFPPNLYMRNKYIFLI